VDYSVNEFSLFPQIVGLIAIIAGGISISKTTDVENNIPLAYELIEAASPHLFEYSLASAGFAAACGVIGLIQILFIVISLAKLRQGKMGYIILAVVSHISTLLY